MNLGMLTVWDMGAVNVMDAVTLDATDRVLVQLERSDGTRNTVASAFDGRRMWRSFPGITHEVPDFYA